MNATETLRNRILVALVPHKGHDGIAGAPDDVLCLRCNAERELVAVEALLEAVKDAAEMCWRCHSKASSETRSERHGQEWCNVCWDRVQPAPVALAAAVRRVETGQ